MTDERQPVILKPNEVLTTVKACAMFECQTVVNSDEDDPLTSYCDDCRGSLSTKALEIIHDFDRPMNQILEHSATMFSTAQQIADFLELSQPTLYSWVKSHLGLSFKQFKRKYICSKNRCEVIDHGATDYSWKYTMADRIHQAKGCVCFVEGTDSLMMTNLSPQTFSEVLKAEVPADVKTNIRKIRYPVRLPILRGPGSTSGFSDD